MTGLHTPAAMPGFAAPFANPAGSPIRELFPYLSQPGMISLAGGYPSPSLFDAEGLAQAAAQAMAGDAQALQYGATEGLPVLRTALAALMGARGIQASAEQMMVTTGSQQAFDLLVRALIEPGDTVLVEVPAYPATLQALRLAQARIVPVPMDEHGLQTDALAYLLHRLPATQRPKLLYTVPNFSNPRGTLLSAQRREALVQLACTHGFWVVEDDPYGELRFDAPESNAAAMPPTLRALGDRLAADGMNPVVYLSSLSKTVAPALRIGWMLADSSLLRRCAIAKQTVDLCTSPLAQMVAARYLASDRYPATVQRARIEYQRRMLALVQGIATQLDGHVQCAAPAGGMFVWATFAQSIDPQALFDAAVSQQVLYVPGTAFYPDNAQLNTMRLSFAAPEVPQIEQAVRRLAAAVTLSMR
ncbi:PLP-dependent aminotransferase family protein [Ralstonia holmesii]|uniref:2-aminoadipate transaminase n=1 Tax=Ralstonia holmesii TaxID=3058602 RepID=A0ABC8Q7U2_9RALS|nr:PLP-dependent aminotransferase family protein [Ralstonia sp. LMG 32967]CAJ0781024.1 2-aminoadipate transaminase [Ralstonia sp. LMG 32967]CAJ0811052.1 2-aminoadipate transaminase [Ralstonia sp. LMG 32967]